MMTSAPAGNVKPPIVCGSISFRPIVQAGGYRRIDSETTEVPEQDAARIATAADALVKKFPVEEVVTYFLTLLLQDAAIWAGVTPWLERHAS